MCSAEEQAVLSLPIAGLGTTAHAAKQVDWLILVTFFLKFSFDGEVVLDVL